MGFFFQAPLPVFNRNQGEIARAEREQKQIEARKAALDSTIASEVETAFQQYTVARNLLESLETGMVTQARDVRDIMEYSYKRGEASFVEFLDAQRAFNETRQTYNEARAEYARNLHLLDSVTGRTVNP